MANTVTIQQNGVSFIVDNRINQYTGWSKKYSNGNNLSGSVYPNPDVADETTGVAALGFNAIEIDWNKATPGLGETSDGITTTGQLLKLIKSYADKKLASVPAATNSVYGGFKLGFSQSGKNYPVQLDSNGKAYVNVPWTDSDTDTNTTYKLTLNGTVKGTTGGVDLGSFYAPTSLGGAGKVLKVNDAGTGLTWGNAASTAIGAATSSAYGGIKIGYSTSGKNYAVQLDSNGKAYVNVPWTDTDTNTTYSQGTNITINSNTISHATPTGASSGSKGNKTTALLASITTDSQGHVTGYQTISVAELKKLLGITDPVTNITLNAAADNSSIAYNGSTTIRASLSNGASATSTTWSIISGDSYGRLGSATGATVTLTGTNNATGGTTNNPGTITSNAPVSSSITYNGNTTVSVSAGAGSVVTGAGTNQTVKVRAINTSATSGYQTKDVTVTVNGKSGSSTSSSVKSYQWEFTEGSDYAKLENDTTATVKVVGNNSSSSDQTVKVRCKVTWANNKSAYSTAQSITVKKQNQGNTWYKGTATETQIQTQSYINGLTYNQATKPANNSTLTMSAGYNVFIFPSSWDTPTFGLVSDFSKVFTPFTASDLGITNPSGKTVFVVYGGNASSTAYIKW